MKRTPSRLFRGTLAAISLLALPHCVEGTTSTSSATAPTEASKPTAPVATTPATPTTPVAPISPHPTTTGVTPVATAPATPSAIPTVPATAAAPTTVPTIPAAGPTSLVGTWESASCGGRAYARSITFADATSFTAQDLVSPCPKGTTCIWSGIIVRSGTYKTEKDLVTLTTAKTSNGPAKTQFPTTLTLDANRAPVEAGTDGKPCVYKQAPVRKP
jgi:hypothetical protein